MASEKVGSAKYELDLDADKFKKNMQGASKQFGGLKKSFEEAEKGSKILLGALAAVAAGVLAFGIESVKQFDEFQRNMAQTDAVIKSTGGAAKVTSAQVGSLATEFSHLTLFTDDQVQSGENLLLTFTNIGQRIFPQATEVMLDMSQALGQDTKSSAIQLGKALQDPILGVTALRRVGVNFSDKQQDLIKRLVETGHAAKAQDMILKELQTEFGGSARAAGQTFGGQLAIAQHHIEDLQEEIGGLIVKGLTPLLDKFNKWISKLGGVEGIIEKVTDLVKEHREEIFILGGAILAGLVPAFMALAASIWATVAPLIPFLLAGAAIGLIVYKLQEAFGGFQPLLERIRDIFNRIWAIVSPTLIPVLTLLWTVISEQLWPALQKLWNLISPYIVPILGVLAFIITGTVVVAINIFVAILSVLIAIITKVIEHITNLIQNIKDKFDVVKKKTEEWHNAIKEAIEKVKGFFTDLKRNIELIIEGIKGVIQPIADFIANTFGDGIARATGKAKAFHKDASKFLSATERSSPSLLDVVRSGTRQIEGLYGGMFDSLNSMAANTHLNLSAGIAPGSSMASGNTKAEPNITYNVSINPRGIVARSSGELTDIAGELVDAFNNKLRATGKQEIVTVK